MLSMLLKKRPTLFARCMSLVVVELVANGIVWACAGILLHRHGNNLLGLAILAWTLGLRHGLDADHIAAIDNATRNMISIGRPSILAGLFFSLGHSTIVVSVNIAIVASVEVYGNLGGLSEVGGKIGPAVSASFLFLIAALNCIFLYSAIRARRKARAAAAAGIEEDLSNDNQVIQGGGFMFRTLGKVLRLVDRAWKMYPVGVLFGLGLDTASSIALLALSAFATNVDRNSVALLPFIFTAGMTLVDSLDSILMVYAYSPPTDSTLSPWALWQDGASPPTADVPGEDKPADLEAALAAPALAFAPEAGASGGTDTDDKTKSTAPPGPLQERAQIATKSKHQAISDLSIVLTVMSICLAFTISLIEIMGLIGDNCSACVRAAENDAGLAGRWWRGWANANEQSGYIGAAVVGAFALLLVAHLCWKRWAIKTV